MFGYQPREELEDDDVETGGSTSDHSDDPLGQQYISPGDICKELYRLSTFDNFRITDASFRKGLAQNGFYFTGFLDRVKCFSCAKSVEKWKPETDNPGDEKWHKPTCSFFNKNPNSGNIPIQSVLGNLGNFEQPSSSQGQMFGYKPQQELGDDDVETCGSTSDHSDDPLGQQYISPGDICKELYRLSTFDNFRITDASFRKGLAQNGFYFTGFLDRVKCFSCAKSVEKWKPETDNPGDEKWHKPTCLFFNKNPNSGNIPIQSLLGNLGNSEQPSSSQGQDKLLHQRGDRGQIRRTFGYPVDSPEGVQQAGGTFQVGPNNPIQIRSGNQHQNITFGTGRQRQPDAPVVLQHQTPPTYRRMANVPFMDHKRYLTNLYLDREIDRLASFARWPTDRPNVPPAALAKSGFFYLGDKDRVQCFSCGKVLLNWTQEHIPEDQHRIKSGECRMILRTETRNIPVPDTDESDQILATNYPLRYPSSPHMREQAQREAMFDRGWPAGGLNVSIAEEIAEAGFYYLGERDRVKCYYCNGGLQNWERNDKPWDEHAKWFPNCQFLLRMKGQRFVHNHLSPNAELDRPLINRQYGSPLDPEDPQIGGRPPTPPPVIIDHREGRRKERKERVENILKNSEIVENVLAMGFAENIVRSVLENCIISNDVVDPDNIYGSEADLLDDVRKKVAEMEQEEEQRSNQASSSNPSEFVLDILKTDQKDPAYVEQLESLRERLDKLREENMCKVCFSNDANMVFIPCKHMACCMECTLALKQCPYCRKRIETAIKAYIE